MRVFLCCDDHRLGGFDLGDRVLIAEMAGLQSNVAFGLSQPGLPYFSCRERSDDCWRSTSSVLSVRVKGRRNGLDAARETIIYLVPVTIAASQKDFTRDVI
jgi:hypothetical protein